MTGITGPQPTTYTIIESTHAKSSEGDRDSISEGGDEHHGREPNREEEDKATQEAQIGSTIGAQ